MEENLADAGQLPGQRLFTLYQQWADGGAGLLLTGNVMISPDALTGPGGVVLQDDSNLDRFKQWAQAGTRNDTHLWMQINHPGRQVYAAMGEQAVAPSDVAVNIAGFSKLFAQPRALTEDEILALVNRFANSANLAEKAGFTGVQIHAAHGYLISQFLSPLTNHRTDQWGGSLDNRARFLFAVIDAVRQRVSANFCVSVKLNSADFQHGGFSTDDAKSVVIALGDTAVDLIELSGGSYESPAMQGNAKETAPQTSTLQREAYFIEFAREIASVTNIPIMVTGGIKRKSVAEAALAESQRDNVQMLGLARAMAYQPNVVNNWQSALTPDIELPQIKWKNKTFAALASMAITKAQLSRLANGKRPNPTLNPLFALVADRVKTKIRTQRYRRWRQRNNAQQVL
jgi:2,4-dienoyl-CoA reductase-like NADH-dependent reductase (Old Yellow Enzyme family)